MRHIQLHALIRQIFQTPDGRRDGRRLFDAHKRLIGMSAEGRQDYFRKYGSRFWSPIKNRMINIVGTKCWYTEVEFIGGPLTIDHYRPRIHYWWLGFDFENYRIACPFSNSPERNEGHGCAGGKGHNFPLLGLGQRATGKNKLRHEKAVILDPCQQQDCNLLAFQADGRPTLNPLCAADPIAARRVNESKILLNLDHPDFNSKREQLYHDIVADVKMYQELDAGSDSRSEIRTRLANRLAPKAPFSTAARYYLQFHRYLDWVEALLAAP